MKVCVRTYRLVCQISAPPPPFFLPHPWWHCVVWQYCKHFRALFLNIHHYYEIQVSVIWRLYVQGASGGWNTVVGIAACYGMDGLCLNTSGGKTLCTHPDWLWGPPSLLYNGYWVSLPGEKQPGHAINCSPPFSTFAACYRENVLWEVGTMLMGCTQGNHGLQSLGHLTS